MNNVEKIKQLERNIGLRLYGDCPECGDYLLENGDCNFCTYKSMTCKCDELGYESCSYCRGDKKRKKK